MRAMPAEIDVVLRLLTFPLRPPARFAQQCGDRGNSEGANDEGVQ